MQRFSFTWPRSRSSWRRLTWVQCTIAPWLHGNTVQPRQPFEDRSLDLFLIGNASLFFRNQSTCDLIISAHDCLHHLASNCSHLFAVNLGSLCTTTVASRCGWYWVPGPETSSAQRNASEKQSQCQTSMESKGPHSWNKWSLGMKILPFEMVPTSTLVCCRVDWIWCRLENWSKPNRHGSPLSLTPSFGLSRSDATAWASTASADRILQKNWELTHWWHHLVPTISVHVSPQMLCLPTCLYDTTAASLRSAPCAAEKAAATSPCQLINQFGGGDVQSNNHCNQTLGHICVIEIKTWDFSRAWVYVCVWLNLSWWSLANKTRDGITTIRRCLYKPV